MTPSNSADPDRIAAVDALIASRAVLPPPEERERLRKGHGMSQQEVANAIGVRKATLADWEKGRTEPRPPQREAYAHLLQTLVELYDAQAPAGPPAPAALAGPTTPLPAVEALPTAPDAAPGTPALRPSSRRPARKAAAKPAGAAAPGDARFASGPLVVLDGDGRAHGVGGLVLDCPATTLPALADWALGEALGAPQLSAWDQPADPLVVLTEAAAVRLGLPARLEGHAARRGLRLPEDHPAVKRLARARWKLTGRGLGPWARLYRPVQDGRRQCVQLAVLPWGALDERTWEDAATWPAPDLARLLGVYAARVITPRGAAATCGLALMTALRPPTRAVQDETTGSWVSGPNPGSLTRPVDPAPPEAVPEHPVAQGWPQDQFLREEAYDWTRDVTTLTDDECIRAWAVGIDINTAFLAAAAGLKVGIGESHHVTRPAFDKKVPGSWYADLSHLPHDARLPSPFTPDGRPPAGPAWYATPTLAYAVELGHAVNPTQAYLHSETGSYLDPWHDRLAAAYTATMDEAITAWIRQQTTDPAAPWHARLTRAGAATPADLDDPALLAALADWKTAAPHLVPLLSAIKATVKGGIGKLRERPKDLHYRPGERWAALERPTWRPDIRAAVISKARVNMHRKLLKTAQLTGLYPLGVLSDCVVYPVNGDPEREAGPLDFLPPPKQPNGRPSGSFRVGYTPGLVKTEGVQPMLDLVDMMEQGYNPARYIAGRTLKADER